MREFLLDHGEQLTWLLVFLFGLTAVLLGAAGILWSACQKWGVALAPGGVGVLTAGAVQIGLLLSQDEARWGAIVGLWLPVAAVTSAWPALRWIPAVGPARALACAAGGLAVLLALSVHLDGAVRIARQGLSPEQADAWLRGKLFPAGAITTAPPDPRYNCHDFAFAGGPNGWVAGRDIEELLHEQSYRPTEAPQPGDVVVYWNTSGAICHSGVVRATGTAGLVLVESKWGEVGRYLHPAEISGYPARPTYYRRSRA